MNTPNHASQYRRDRRHCVNMARHHIAIARTLDDLHTAARWIRMASVWRGIEAVERVLS